MIVSEKNNEEKIRQTQTIHLQYTNVYFTKDAFTIIHTLKKMIIIYLEIK